MTSPQITAADEAHEAHIKHLDAEMLRHMDQWVATGCFAARGSADAYWLRMKDAIAARSPEVVARMEVERGLS